MNSYKPLSNHDIDNYYHDIDDYHGCYSKDVLPKKIKTGFYIINLDNYSGAGTHWCLIYNANPKYILYIDPFGLIAPIDAVTFMRKAKKEIFYSTEQLQNENSVLCGYYCIYFADQLMSGRKFNEINANDFTVDTNQNDKVIMNYFQHTTLGAGLIDTIKNVANRVKGFFIGRNDFSPNVRNLLSLYGNNTVKHITVARTPVSKIAQILVDFLSLGTVGMKKKELNYDDIYHLFMVVTLDNGQRLRIEKNEEIGITDNYMARDNGMNVNITHTVTFSDLLNKPLQAIGDSFYRYNARTNNCQLFVTNVLKNNNLFTSALGGYINQNAEELLSKSPDISKKVLDLATELRARSSILINGYGNFNL